MEGVTKPYPNSASPPRLLGAVSPHCSFVPFTHTKVTLATPCPTQIILSAGNSSSFFSVLSPERHSISSSSPIRCRSIVCALQGNSGVSCVTLTEHSNHFPKCRSDWGLNPCVYLCTGLTDIDNNNGCWALRIGPTKPGPSVHEADSAVIFQVCGPFQESPWLS